MKGKCLENLLIERNNQFGLINPLGGFSLGFISVVHLRMAFTGRFQKLCNIYVSFKNKNSLKVCRFLILR